MVVLLHGARAFGAVEAYVVDLVSGLRARGIEATLVHLDDPVLAPFAALEGGGIHVLPVAEADLLAGSVVAVGRIRSLVRSLRPDVVHLIDTWPVAAVGARLAGVHRLVLSHHTPELPRTDSLAGSIWWRLGWLMRPDVIYTSAADRDGDGRPLLRRHVIPYGLHLERFASATAILEPNGPTIGTAARLEPQKRHDVLVDAFAQVRRAHQDARLVIVGGGSERAALERRAHATGLGDAVIFAGPRDDVPAWLASLDVFVLTSAFEGLCYAVLEAQAARVPVVATPVGGVRETVVDDVTGLVVPVGDVDATARAIDRLLSEPRTGSRLAATAADRVQRFSIDEMVDATVAVYGVASRQTAPKT